MTIDHLGGHDDIALALGNMIVAWSGAEATLVHAMAIVGSLDINQANSGFYRIPTFESRVKFILAMIPDWEASTYDKPAIIKAIDAISGLASTRNSWVHNSWVADVSLGGGGIFVVNARVPRGSQNQLKPVKAHDIRHHAETVISRTKILYGLLFPQP
ncbi:hypothetical protein [Mesorhizobium sp.]|uniref:hypothetical protein n=1 Tax=Mesorhizobium sp. TaxID=1871066 RepID=UPI0025D19935|nr:hypothetical protein [Mesorhizobium sp.]